MSTQKLVWATILCGFATIASSAGEIELISRTLVAPQATTTASGHSLGSQYSPDGSRILFSSDATDLIDGVANGYLHI